MLGKCAEAQALRKAFPAELSGVYTHEEMDQANNLVDISENSTPQPQTSNLINLDCLKKSLKNRFIC